MSNWTNNMYQSLITIIDQNSDMKITVNIAAPPTYGRYPLVTLIMKLHLQALLRDRFQMRFNTGKTSYFH